MQLLDNIKHKKVLLCCWLLWWFHFKGKEPESVDPVLQHFWCTCIQLLTAAAEMWVADILDISKKVVDDEHSPV